MLKKDILIRAAVLLLSLIIVSIFLVKLSGPTNKPDLAITRVGFNKSPPFNVGDIIYFNADIANLGNTDADDFKIDVYLDGRLWDSGSGYFLAAQQRLNEMRAGCFDI